MLLSGDRLVGIGLDVTERRRTEDERERRARQLAGEAAENARLLAEVTAARQRLETLSRRLVDLQEQERHAIARELHDEVGQILTGLNLMLETRRRGAEIDLAAVKDLVGQLQERVRDLSLDLRPPMLDDLGLVAALLWHVERYRAQTGVHVRFQHRGLASRLPSGVEIAAYRIVQEALTNVARHAAVAVASVDLWAHRGVLELRVEDAGRGFDPAAVSGPSSGLTGMRERTLHNVVRQALRTLLETEPRFVVLGEAGDGLQAVELAARLEPDVLVADLMMPGLGGMEVTRQLARRSPATRVVILSMSISEAHVLEALRGGARGYVRKDATAADLIHAIDEVAAGHLYLSPPFSDHAIEAYRRRAAEALDPYDTLTSREREVFHLAAEDLGNVEIAARLGISPRTAETHRANALRKLRLRRQGDVVRYALRRGLLPLDR